MYGIRGQLLNSKIYRILTTVLLLCLFVNIDASLGGMINSQNRQLLLLGLQMFPALAGGDKGLNAKRNTKGEILLLIVYQEDQREAEKTAELLIATAKNIKGYPVKVEITKDLTFEKYIDTSIGGIFLAEPLSASQRKQVIRYGIARHVIVFSPFKGDVKAGVLAGIHVSAQILPALNLNTLRRSEIRFSNLFLKVAKTFE